MQKPAFDTRPQFRRRRRRLPSWLIRWIDRHPVVTRMRVDFRLAIPTLFSFCSAMILLPFAVFRFAVGDWLVGAVDLAIVAAFAALVGLAWKSGRTLLAGSLTAATATLACLVALYLLDLNPYWAFSTLVANFLLAERRFAVLASAVLVAMLAFCPVQGNSGIDHISLVAVATMVSLFSLIFATRVDSQHELLSDMAGRDGLTGALNRRSLDSHLNALCHADPRPAHPHTLALIDLDRFKRLNDSLGHDAGDRVLMGLTRLVESSTRRGDRFYRYGGEEFVLLMPDTRLKDAETAMRSLLLNVDQNLGDGDHSVTVSIGIAGLRDGDTRESWLKRADEALMAAKRGGRNRIEISD